MFTSESLQHIIKSFLKLLVSVSQCGYPGIPMNFQRRMKPDLWTGSSRTPQGDYRYLYVQLMHMRTPQGRYVYLCIIYIYIYSVYIHYQIIRCAKTASCILHYIIKIMYL